jgi:hypothetical protein
MRDVPAVIDFVLSHLQLWAIVGGFIGTFITIRRQTQVFQTYVALEFFRRYADIFEGNARSVATRQVWR